MVERPARSTGGRPRASDSDPQSVWPKFFEAWPVVFLVGLLIYWSAPGWLAGSERRVDGAAALVDRTPPRVPSWDKPPKGVEDVLKDLGRGDCWTASARLRGLRKSLDESRDLRVLEGAAFICAGDGPAAALAVEPLLELDFRGDALWVAANAALLMGSVDHANRLLQIMIERDTESRRDAEALIQRIATL